MKQLRSRKAFTIVEMVIVIAVIAILATVLVPTISGVIQMANISTDRQFAASLNVQLALWQVENRPIADEYDLQEAINHYYGDLADDGDYFASITAKSAEQGYQFWYAYNKGVMVVATADNVMEELEKHGITADDLVSVAAPVVEEPVVHFLSNRHAPTQTNSVVMLSNRGNNKSGFTSSSLRSDLIPGLYLLGNGIGNKDKDKTVIDVVTMFETIEDPEDYKEAIEALEDLEVLYQDKNDNHPHKQAVNTLIEKIKTTTIVTNAGAFRYGDDGDLDDVTNVYVPMSVTYINVEEVYLYKTNENGEKDVDDGNSITPETPLVNPDADVTINLPKDVIVAPNGLVIGHEFAEDETEFADATKIYVKTNDAEALKDIFDMMATDCVIVTEDNSEYVIIGTEIHKLPLQSDTPPVVSDLGVSDIPGGEPGVKPEISVEITYDNENKAFGEDDDYFYNGTLYLAWDFDSAKLTLANRIPSNMVEWTVSEDALIEVNKGVITLKQGATFDAKKSLATVTATLKNDPSKTYSINIQLVFPTTVQWGWDDITLFAPADNKNVTLNYTKVTQFELALGGIGYTQSGYVKLNSDAALKISYATSGDLFKIQNIDGKYYLVLDPAKIAENNKQSLTVTYGTNDTTYVTETYVVTVVDNSAMGMDLNKIVDNACKEDDCTDKENCDHNDIKLGQTYLFRVGNGNPVCLNKLFNAYDVPAKIKLTIYDASKFDTDNGVYDEINKTTGDLDATYTSSLTSATWASSTIKFSGTGVAIIRIENEINKKYTQLAVEVVNGNNVTTYSELKGNVDSVLLSDIKMTSNGNFNLSANKYIYGNGFTFDITEGQVEKSTRFGIIELASGSLLDNVVVIGATFPNNFGNSYDGENGSNYYVAAVYLNGGTISNSYISGCRTPVRSAGGTIINTTLQGGKYSNLFADAGTTTIEDLTTINQPDSVDGNVGGLGIVLDNSAVLEIKGNLTQHNWINNEEESFGGSNQYATQLFDIIFANKDQVKHIQFAYDGKTWVNTGIFRLKNTTSIMGSVTGYGQVEASGSAYGMSFTGYAYTFSKNASYVFNGRVTPESYVPTEQGTHAPTVTWSKDEYKDGKHDIKFEEGQTATFNPNVLTATHYGNSLAVTVKMDGVDYTGKEIVFDDKETTTHTIVYSYYAEPCYDKDGKETSTQVLFEQKLEVKVTVAKKVGAPTFTFYYGTNGSASAGSPHVTQPSNSYTSIVVQDGSTYYIMPNASATSANAIGSKTINGKTIYYPIVDGINVRSGGSTDYDFDRYYPIFKAVSISDNGKSYSYSGTKEMPAAVTWVTAEFDSGNSVSGVGGGITLYDSKLCQHQSKAGDTESGGTSVVKFSYVAEDGNTYYYFVGYRFYDEGESEGCLVEGTMITMADGTQKAVEDLVVGDMIMVFNHVTGKYEAMPLIFNTHADEVEAKDYQVLNLEFSNNNNLKIAISHGLFDMTLMQYVYITPSNYQDYVGHEFYALNSDGTGGESVTLVNAYVQTEHVRIFCPVTYFHMNSFANGFLNTPNIPGGITGLVNYFEYDADLKYNEEAMQSDIEKYGLYTYEDFSDYISEAAYNSSPSVYLKVAVGKGMITYEQIIDVINYLLAGSLID